MLDLTFSFTYMISIFIITTYAGSLNNSQSILLDLLSSSSFSILAGNDNGNASLSFSQLNLDGLDRSVLRLDVTSNESPKTLF